MSHPDDPGLSVEQRALIDLLARRVFRSERNLSVADWEVVLQEAERQSVFPLCYAEAAALLPASSADAWKRRYYQHISHNYKIINAHHEVHDLLAAAGISYAIIKGCASSFYYPEPELRTMGDVDIYVSRSSVEEVRTLFEARGCRAYGLEHIRHWTYQMDGVNVEVHWFPAATPATDDGTIENLFDDLLERRFSAKTDDGDLFFPDPFHHGIIMLLHVANHLTSSGIGLRHLLDWLVFENNLTEEAFCCTFEPTLRKIGLWRFACVLTAVGIEYFGCQPRCFCSNVDPELAMGLLRDIFAGGNFGIKDRDRYNQSKFLLNADTRQIDGGSRIGHLFRFMNQRARLNYPAASKYPILLPLGWFITLRRRSWFVKKGVQTKFRFHNTLKQAKEREAIYEQLGLFENLEQ